MSNQDHDSFIRNYLFSEINTLDEPLTPAKLEKTDIYDSKSLASLDDLDTFYQYQKSEIGTNEEDGDKDAPNKTPDGKIFIETADDNIVKTSFNKGFTTGTKMDVSNLLQLMSQSNIRNMFNPQGRYVKNYIPINNQNRISDPSYDGTYKTKWNMNYGIPISRKGFIDVNFRIRDIVSMRIQALSIVCRSTFMQNQLSRNRTAILIEELASQSFVATEGNNFHFMMLQSIASQGPSISIQTIDPYYLNRGNFYFRTPITKLDSLTISLYNPFQPIPLDPEIISGVVIQGTNPATIIFSSEHGLYEDFITISGYTTGNPVADATIIASMNTTFSYPNFTVVDLFTITVPVNVIPVTPLPSNPAVSGYRPVNMTGALEIITLSSTDEELDG